MAAVNVRSVSAARAADVAVVGAGAAGLYAALCAARAGARVTLISASPLARTASYWAQGGLAAALADEDSPELHLADTIRAGRGLVRASAAEILVHEAPACVGDLQSLGVRFDGDRFGRLALGLEGGHSVRRIVHAGGSATGRRLVRQLSALAAGDELVRVLEGVRARALWIDRGEGRCRGVICESLQPATIAAEAPEGEGPAIEGQAVECEAIAARAVILATGGGAALWQRTTNPPGSRGSGLLLAHVAGARLADLELLQFHPTAVIGVPGREGFLITEAIRGEGATLHDRETGDRFVDELAPRDEVSRAIQARLRATGATAVGLDMRAIDAGRFPNVFAALREVGLDPARELVPVAPAAHYLMGGIEVDLQARSGVPGLYAVGEVSCTGLHGANRLASNSLSECLVFARRAVAAALSEPAQRAGGAEDLEAALEITGPPPVEPATRQALWSEAGIERSAEGLKRLLDDAHPLARMIARCALAREESRGAHLRADYPQRDPRLDLRHAVLGAEHEVAWETWE